MLLHALFSKVIPMTGLGFALVFVAAIVHAAWNFLAKRAGGGATFVFLINAFATLIYTPPTIAVIIFQHLQISAMTLVFIVGSAAIHLIYFLVLQRGYCVGDLSVVYPLPRGTGPMLSTTAAIVFLGERPTPLALVGILLIVVGVFVLTGDPLKLWSSGSRQAVAYGLLTGAFIALYTLWDKYAVSQVLISPVLLNYGCNLCETVLLIPFACRHRHQVRLEWQIHRQEVLGTAVLSPLAYILVLIAMVFTPVSYVAPIRELSILVGAVMGTRLLAEEDAPRRLVAALVIVLGILTLAVN